MSKKRKKSFVGFTTKDWDMVWTFFNTINVSVVIQKTEQEASVLEGVIF